MVVASTRSGWNERCVVVVITTAEGSQKRDNAESSFLSFDLNFFSFFRTHLFCFSLL